MFFIPKVKSVIASPLIFPSPVGMALQYNRTIISITININRILSSKEEIIEVSVIKATKKIVQKFRTQLR